MIAPLLLVWAELTAPPLAQDGDGEMSFDVQVDVLGDGDWHSYRSIAVPSGTLKSHVFPRGFSAHWVRIVPSESATAQFFYAL